MQQETGRIDQVKNSNELAHIKEAARLTTLWTKTQESLGLKETLIVHQTARSRHPGNTGSRGGPHDNKDYIMPPVTLPYRRIIKKLVKILQVESFWYLASYSSYASFNSMNLRNIPESFMNHLFKSGQCRNYKSSKY